MMLVKTDSKMQLDTNNDEFEIKVLGESSFLFSQGGTRIITDPWFGESIYGGTWTQFPPPIVSISDLSNITHIFISHVHSDHCCFQSIKKILTYSPNAEFIFLNRGEGRCFLKKKLLVKLGQSIQDKFLIQDAYKEELNGVFRTWCIPPEDDNPLNKLIDSSLLIESKNGLVLFSNDNIAHTKHAKFIDSLNIKSFLALIPFSGGSGYPSSYLNITHEEKLEIAKTIRNNYADQAISFLNQTNFEYFMPVAGNHIIVGKSTDWHRTTSFLFNPYRTLSYCYKKVLSSTGIYCEPGDLIQMNETFYDKNNLADLSIDFDFRKSHFIESFSSRIAIDINHKNVIPPSVKFIEDYFESIGQKLTKLIRNKHNKDTYSKYDPIFVLNSGCKILLINFDGFKIKDFIGNDFFRYLDNTNIKYWLSIRIEPLVLQEISKRVFHINEADGGGLIDFKRNGDYYPDLYMSFFDSF